MIYTWIYNSTRGSALLAMILHACTNLANVYLALSIGAQAVVAGLWVVAAAVVVARFGRADLSRSRRVDRDAVFAVGHSEAGHAGVRTRRARGEPDDLHRSVHLAVERTPT